MKNKKLFAILTLVCFMFTLMPVAAFANVDEQNSYAYTEKANVEVSVNKNVDLTFNVKDANGASVTTTLYVWFEEDGRANVPSTALGTLDNAGNFTAATDGIITVANAADTEVAFSRTGEYELHASTVMPTLSTTWAEAIADVADYELETEADYRTVVVTAKAADSDKYVLGNLVGITGEVVNNAAKTYVEDNDVAELTTVPETNGVETVTVSFDVHQNVTNGVLSAATIYAKDIEVTATSGLEISDLTVKRDGSVSFDVAAYKAGTHKIYVTLDSFKATIKVDANVGEAEEIEVAYAAQTPVNILTANAGLANSLVFKIYDENGNELNGATNDSGFDKATDAQGQYPNYVALVSQPADSDIDNDELYLVPVTTSLAEAAQGVAYSTIAAGWTVAGATFVEEGTYEFKVTLNDGTYAKASIKVMEAGDPVALSISYDAETVQLGATISPKAIVWLDKNYVATTIYPSQPADAWESDIEFAVTGAAVASVNGATITVKDDEKYVGSEINVTVVDEENNLVATKTLTVASEAKELVFDTTAVPVDSTRTVGVKLVDETGKAVALTGVSTAEAYVIVLDKPADSDVTIGDANLTANKGQFTFTIAADKVGVVKVQAVLKAQDSLNVVRYYTGVQEIKVGATGIEDTVVMSIGANKIVVNDEVVAIDAAPMIKDSRTFVPFRALAEAFGAVVEFDAATQAVVAELDGTKVVMTIGSEVYTVNGVAKTADVAPFISDSRTMVPVRFAAEAFGITVTPIYAEDGSVADVLFTK